MSRLFSATQIQLNQIKLLSDTFDPSSAGMTAVLGSEYTRSGTAGLYLKTSAPDTGWTKYVQSMAWFVVSDYGAVGDGTTDDTAAIQACINDCAGTTGGRVYFPPGTYAVTQLALTTVGNVELFGAGGASVIKWVWNAASAAGSMITISNGTNRIQINGLRLDGSGLTNPAAGRSNHLLSIATSGGDVLRTHVWHCFLGNMVASSGDGVNVTGAGANVVSKLWIVDNVFDGCSRFSIGGDVGINYAWVVDNYLTNCETEIAFVAGSDVANFGIQIRGNDIVHTSVSVRHGLRFEGGATALNKESVIAQNLLLGGFATIKNSQYVTSRGNVIASGAYASADAVLKIFGAVSDCTFTENIIDRDSGASVGPCVSMEKSTGAVVRTRVGKNLLVNEKVGANFVTLVDCQHCSAGANMCVASDAGSTNYGIDVQAVTVASTGNLIGPANQITALAGSFAAAVRFLANGANQTDTNMVGNLGDSCDYQVRYEIGGGGTFGTLVTRDSNTIDSSVGGKQESGVTVREHIGFNTSTFGANLISGAGAPEGVVTARPGSVYLRDDGSPVFNYKETGNASTGWFGVGGAPIPFGANDLTTVATVVYLAPGYEATAQGTTEIQFAVTRAGTIRNLFVQGNSPGTTAGAITFTVRKNGVDTTLTCQLDNVIGGSASDVSHQFTVVAGDLISISAVKAGVVVAGLGAVTATIELA